MRLPRLALLAAVATGPTACGQFALKREPFTPDAAPVSEVAVSGSDTTYVLRTESYVLRARRRELLWSRRALDDAAWRYRWLFGAPAPRIELALDSADVDTARAATAAPLVRRAARAWTASDATLPWWLSGGATRLVADADARAGAPQRSASDTEPLPLAELLAAQRPARIDRGSSVEARGAALLLFLRERDPAFVAALPAALRSGRTLPDLLAGSAALPHTLAALDADWGAWLKKQRGSGVRRLAGGR